MLLILLLEELKNLYPMNLDMDIVCDRFMEDEVFDDGTMDCIDLVLISVSHLSNIAKHVNHDTCNVPFFHVPCPNRMIDTLQRRQELSDEEATRMATVWGQNAFHPTSLPDDGRGAQIRHLKPRCQIHQTCQAGEPVAKKNTYDLSLESWLGQWLLCSTAVKGHCLITSTLQTGPESPPPWTGPGAMPARSLQ